jgi:hypothetical protein
MRLVKYATSGDVSGDATWSWATPASSSRSDESLFPWRRTRGAPRKNAALALMGLGQFSLDYLRVANSQMGLARFLLDYSRVVNSQRTRT